MRQWREPKTITLHYRNHKGERHFHTADDILNTLIWNGAYIQDTGDTFDPWCRIKVEGPDGYKASVGAETPVQCVRKALADYEVHVADTEDTRLMLADFRATQSAKRV